MSQISDKNSASNTNLKQIIIDKLTKNLNVTSLEVEDRSFLHKNHPQITENPDIKSDEASHLHIVIRSEKFENLDVLSRHKMVYDIIKDEIIKLHAISIDAKKSECSM